MKKSLTTGHIILFATIFSITLTAMTFLTPSYDKLWLSIEIITLPVIYTLSYEHFLQKQKEGFENDITKIILQTRPLVSELETAKREIETLKKVEKLPIKRKNERKTKRE